PAPSVKPPPEYALWKKGWKRSPLTKRSSALFRSSSVLLGTYGCRFFDLSVCSCSMAASRVGGSACCATAEVAGDATSATKVRSLHMPEVRIDKPTSRGVAGRGIGRTALFELNGVKRKS